MIESSLRQIGAARSGVIDENGVILAGNGTFDALTAAGINKIKIVEADGQEWVVVRRKGLTAEQKRALAIADNRAAELAEWDGPMLAAQGIDLAPWFSDQELAKIGAGGATVADEGPDPQFDKAEALREQYGVELGQVWELGAHRLMCGDSTIRAEVDALTTNIKIEMILTDPPYGVAYSGQNETMFFGLGKKGKSRQKLKGDDSSQDAERLITATLALRIAPIAFIWCAPQFYDVCKKIIECAGYSLSTVIVWNKNHANFGAMGACYKPKFEMAVVCKTEKLPWFGPDNEVTVWDCNRAATNNFHPTQKPVELFARAINNHTFGPVTIYDPFLGSGTTLIACEQLGRKCYAMEISPAYVAVAIQRWVDLTGKEPKRIDDATRGRTTAKTNKASHPARQSKQAARARAAQ